MNYQNIADAVLFYKRRGYVYFEDAPWLVDTDAYFATKPADAKRDVVLETRPKSDLSGYFVASGEQSFIQMMLDGQTLKRAICVTPCFRAEKKLDDLRQTSFLKAELINAQDVDEGHLIHMVHDACSFFEKFSLSVRVKKTSTASYDIIEKSTTIELGSYGIRSIAFEKHRMSWIYGTACAEPRLSAVIKRAAAAEVVGR